MNNPPKLMYGIFAWVGWPNIDPAAAGPAEPAGPVRRDGDAIAYMSFGGLFNFCSKSKLASWIMNTRAITAAITVKNADSNALFSSITAATEPYRFSENG